MFEHVQWQPVLFGNKDFAQLIKKWNLDEFVTLQRCLAVREFLSHLPRVQRRAGSPTTHTSTQRPATPLPFCRSA